uniref:Putative secreted protein n=1 Tax=Ixodes ricinus TaxID=34613 RepID=A0A147BC61_IXORI
MIAIAACTRCHFRFAADYLLFFWSVSGRHGVSSLFVSLRKWRFVADKPSRNIISFARSVRGKLDLALAATKVGPKKRVRAPSHASLHHYNWLAGTAVFTLCYG